MRPPKAEGPRGPRAAGQRAARAPDVSFAGIERAALAYLTRFDSSVQNLRRVLTERLKRAQRATEGPLDAARAKSDIEALLTRYQQSGLLDDRRYATHQLESLRRRGVSRRAAEQRLVQRGVGRELLAELLEAEQAESEVEAARAYLRRRRLAPRHLEATSPWPEEPEEPEEPDYLDTSAQPEGSPSRAAQREANARQERGPKRRAPSAAEAQRQRALAALARRGFSFDVARRALEAESNTAR